ncbi:molybdopterin-binding protein [Rhizocola hellebori]|uniref:Molybdopterin-binding protein n=1 Tax=Rhizocola hellebori TaxID=1392758 RepID=A0A8J3Q885_9ACTN|nr:molybdopterin-dependent oxidoreductase [Rhizocola hellebori]GIH05224.1 molybdopterin-binding protein [Rhizocola hellebori]
MARRFTSLLRSPKLTSQLGVTLGIAIGICFVTGYLSHAIQQPPWWFAWPSRPVNLYRVTQGLHVATGLALAPLLSVKLWSVYPKLFRWPSLRDPVHALERVSLAVLVATALFQVFSGILNIFRWYQPMSFFFTRAHYWTAWALAGSVLVHLGVKLPIVRRALSTSPRREPVSGGLSRRGLLASVAAATGVITLATVGQTVRPLASVSLLAPRDPRIGPQGLPVNKSAVSAGVVAMATDPGYRLELAGPAGVRTFSLADLNALPQHTSQLPITCVEGWSANALWSGVRIADLVAAAGGDDTYQVYVVSMQQGAYSQSTLAPPHARDPLTLLALRLHGEPLHLDHGYPCRLIAPNRPGVMQTKWVQRLVVERPT